MLWAGIADTSAYFGASAGSEEAEEVPRGFTSSWFSVRELAAALAGAGECAAAEWATDECAAGEWAAGEWASGECAAGEWSVRALSRACGAAFERPNPLKLHLFLRCERPSAAAFWARALPRLAAAAGEAPRAEGARLAGGHRCGYCGKLYSRKYGLKIHVRTHTGYKPLRCRYCARAFGDPSNLNKHVRLHAAAADARALACALCGQRLARRRDLERHLRARHAPASALTAV